VRLLPAVLALLALSCVSTQQRVEPLASSQVVPDFHTYDLRRVGLLPFCGERVIEEQANALQGAFLGELARAAAFEIVPLRAGDLEEIPQSQPFHAGWIQPRTVIDLARRFRLDAVMIGTVIERQYFTPQRLGVQLDIVAAETGVPIWTATVHLDASEESVRRGVQAWCEQTRSAQESGEAWELSLLSPRRFAQFAAYQIALQL
jgi:hypothetical protein